MSYELVNPYCTLDQLKDELKRSRTDTSIDDELSEAIVNGSRWIDNYLGRDFFFHDYATEALTFDYNSPDAICGRVFLDWPILELTEVLLGTTALTVNADYTVQGRPPHDNRILLRGSGAAGIAAWQARRRGDWQGDWFVGSQGEPLSIKGTFGYLQSFFRTVTAAGDTGGQLTNWHLTGLSAAVLYWRLEDVGGQARVRLYSDAAWANLVAEGTGANISTLTLAEQNSSGISGTVDVDYSLDDIDAGNKLTPGAAVVDRTQVPIGIPSQINLCTRLVAAALSGHNRKQVVAVDGGRQDNFADGGTKVDFIDRTIPRIVYKMLGKQMTSAGF